MFIEKGIIMKSKIFLTLLTSFMLLTSCSSPTDSGDDNTESSQQDNTSSENQNGSSNDEISSSIDISSDDSNSSSEGTFTSEPNDQDCAYDSGANTLACDEKTYKTAVIGSQVWMVENLNYGIQRDFVTDEIHTGSQKYCYNDESSNCALKGGLYQWHTAMLLSPSCATELCEEQISEPNHQGICPNGWHIPSKNDWDELAIAVGGTASSSFPGSFDDAGTFLKSEELGGTNNFGFDGEGAGYQLGLEFKSYVEINETSYYWEAEEASKGGAFNRQLKFNKDRLSRFSFSDDKENGFSVRCLKD